MSGKAKDILQLDLYGLLGIESVATTKEVPQINYYNYQLCLIVVNKLLNIYAFLFFDSTDEQLKASGWRHFCL